MPDVGRDLICSSQILVQLTRPQEIEFEISEEEQMLEDQQWKAAVEEGNLLSHV